MIFLLIKGECILKILRKLFRIDKIKKEFEIEIDNLKNQFKRQIPQGNLNYLTIGISEHCNLNCTKCDHFSPLAYEKFYDLKDFKKDIERLSHLSKGDINKIAIEGGEPLLNPDVIEYIKITRDNFPKTNIVIITNGILLNKMNEEFWIALKENNITLEITKYPINVDYEKIKIKAKEENINLKMLNEVLKTSHKVPLDMEGKQNAVENFVNCWHANSCVFLKNGKLYTCTIAPNIEHFNKFFNKDLKLKEDDGIDIYKAQSMGEILAFLARPISFCKYCKVKERSFNHKWQISKREINEWT